MLSATTKKFEHRNVVGGVALATIITRKRTVVNCSNMDTDIGPQKEIARPMKAELCLSCVSCMKKKCYFAFAKFPSCYLAKSLFE